MRRSMIGLLMFILVVAACGGGDDIQQEVQNPQTPTIRNYPTVAPFVNLTATALFASQTAAVSGGGISDTGCPIPAGWQGYVVTAGDTLSGIATSIASTVATIQQGNCLDDTEIIYVGFVLYLPSLPPGAPTLGPTSVIIVTQAAPTTATCTYPAGWIPYTVVSGDTLGSIAERTNTTIAVLQNGNCLPSSEFIYAGQTLYLPRWPGDVPTVDGITILPTTPTVSGICTYPAGWQPYTVLPGDTLSIIAERVGSTAAELQASNCLLNPDTIYVGQTLYLPTGGSVLPTPSSAPTLTPWPSASAVAGGDLPETPMISVRPTLLREDGALVTLQDTVALDAGVILDADRVNYWAATSPTDSNPVLVRIDTDPFDGTTVEYTFNDFDPELYFFAVAENEFGTSSSPLAHVVYDPTFAIGSGKPDIFPFLGFDGTIYTLEPGVTVIVSWLDAPASAVRVEFHLVQDNADSIITTDTNLADGARGLWLIPTNLRGLLYARAVFSNGTINDSDVVNIYSEQ